MGLRIAKKAAIFSPVKDSIASSATRVNASRIAVGQIVAATAKPSTRIAAGRRSARALKLRQLSAAGTRVSARCANRAPRAASTPASIIRNGAKTIITGPYIGSNAARSCGKSSG